MRQRIWIENIRLWNIFFLCWHEKKRYSSLIFANVTGKYRLPFDVNTIIKYFPTFIHHLTIENETLFAGFPNILVFTLQTTEIFPNVSDLKIVFAIRDHLSRLATINCELFWSFQRKAVQLREFGKRTLNVRRKFLYWID